MDSTQYRAGAMCYPGGLHTVQTGLESCVTLMDSTLCLYRAGTMWLEPCVTLMDSTLYRDGALCHLMDSTLCLYRAGALCHPDGLHTVQGWSRVSP
ncbi:hypothetical protein ACOMHN_042398 [Nucella lapillus]